MKDYCITTEKFICHDDGWGVSVSQPDSGIIQLEYKELHSDNKYRTTREMSVPVSILPYLIEVLSTFVENQEAEK